MSATPYPETADIETSSDAYATRFAGATGAWMLHVQEKLTLELLARRPAKTVLDVGGGHGQIARPLVREGYTVTVLGSDPSCEHRIRDLTSSGACTYQVGNVIALPFADRSFDVVVCFRLVTHCEAWPTLMAELCRVARDAVIVDYPTSQSVNAIAPALFNAKRKYETNTRHWTLFRHEQIREAFAAQHWAVRQRRGQFLLPMVVHRMLKCRPLSAALEAVLRVTGLTHLCGSPVIVRAEPSA